MSHMSIDGVISGGHWCWSEWLAMQTRPEETERGRERETERGRERETERGREGDGERERGREGERERERVDSQSLRQ